jgi:hypothetical protein
MRILKSVATPVGNVSAIHAGNARATYVPPQATLGVGTGTVGTFGGNVPAVYANNGRRTIIRQAQARTTPRSNLRQFNSY